MTDSPDNDRPDERAPSAEDEPSFVRRWSRRKHQAQAQEQARSQEPARERVDPGGEAHASDSADETAPEQLTEPSDDDLPPVEALGEGSDYRGFLSPRVSESLRRAALRKLFQSPRYNVRDGLDDYDGDYTRYSPMGDDTVTAHAKFHTERLRRRAQADADEPADIPAAAEETPPPDEPPVGEPEESSAAAGDESDADPDGAEPRANRK